MRQQLYCPDTQGFVRKASAAIMPRSRMRPPRVRPAERTRKTKVTQHNLRVKRAVDERKVSLARKALLYPVDSTRPRMVLLPSRESYDPACGCKAWSVDLDTDKWFGGPQAMTTVHYFPGTDCRLKNAYDIFVLARRERRSRSDEPNGTVHTLFNLRWIGNIIVTKRGFRDRGCALNITSPEISLINSLVERWLQLEL